MAPLPLIRTLAAVTAELPEARLRVDLHTDAHDPGALAHALEVVAVLRGLAAEGAVDLREHDRFDADALWAFLSSLDLIGAPAHLRHWLSGPPKPPGGPNRNTRASRPGSSAAWVSPSIRRPPRGRQEGFVEVIAETLQAPDDGDSLCPALGDFSGFLGIAGGPRIGVGAGRGRSDRQYGVPGPAGDDFCRGIVDTRGG